MQHTAFSSSTRPPRGAAAALVLAALIPALPGCGFFAQMQKQQQERAQQCVADRNAMTSLPPEPPMQNFTGRWSCIFQDPNGNVTEAIDVAQSGSRVTVSMRDGYGNSAVGDGQVAGHVLAYSYGAQGTVFRLEGDNSGRLLDGQLRFASADDCSPRRYTCTRRY